MRKIIRSAGTAAILILSIIFSQAQNFNKVNYGNDSTNNYYLAIAPQNPHPLAALVLFCAYRPAESIVPETKLHNVAYANGILTIYASVGNHFLPDDATIAKMNQVIAHVRTSYHLDSTQFAIAGYDIAGMAVLRYAELEAQFPNEFAITPKVIFTIASDVDLVDLYHTSQRLIRNNQYQPSVSDAKFFIAAMNTLGGSPEQYPDKYKKMSPFISNDTTAGNEQWLKKPAIRLYYDTDIDWYLKARRKSYFDTNLPSGSELINRLNIAGNKKAEFMVAKTPGMRSNGQRNASAYSIVDENDCIQWIKRELHIFDPFNPMGFNTPYRFDKPDGWGLERTASPPPFAPKFRLTGIEEIRFTPGWGNFGQPDYWSLAYMYWLDPGQTINATVIKENLEIYFDGLVQTGGGPVPHQIPPDKLIHTKVQSAVIKTEPDDQETYAGTIDMLDYMAMQPIRLNFMAHVKSCKGHTALFIEASPKPYSDLLWLSLEKLKKDFSCGE